MCKNGNERFISITALINLLFIVMSFLLFLCGVDVTISDVSLTHKSKFWLDCPKSSCMVKYGHPFTTSQPFHTTYRHKGQWKLVCLATKAQDSSLELNWSSHLLSQTLTSPRANPSAHHRVMRTMSHTWCSLAVRRLRQRVSPGSILLAFSKTGQMIVLTLFFGWGERRQNETA